MPININIIHLDHLDVLHVILHIHYGYIMQVSNATTVLLATFTIALIPFFTKKPRN